MIVEWVVDRVLGFVGGLLEAVLPEGEPLGISVPSGVIVGYTWLNSFLPLSEALAAAALVLLVMGIVFGLRLAITIWHQIPKPFMGT